MDADFDFVDFLIKLLLIVPLIFLIFMLAYYIGQHDAKNDTNVPKYVITDNNGNEENYIYEYKDKDFIIIDGVKYYKK